MTWLIAIYALGWVGFSSFLVLLVSEDPHPRPRQQALAIIGLGALWPVLVLVGIAMAVFE